METMLAAVRAADRATLYSMYFPDHGGVKAAAVAGCVCLDGLTCTECERILGVSFRAIEHAARKKQRTGRPVPVARVDAGLGYGLLGRGSHGGEGSGAAIYGMADRLGRGSHAPSGGVEGLDAASSHTADRLVVGTHPPPVREERSGAAISGTADLLVVGSQPDAVERSGTADRLVVCSQPDRVDGSGTEDRLVVGSHPPSDGIERSDAAISRMTDRLVPGSNARVEELEPAISGMAAPPVPASDRVEGSEAAISSTAARLVPGSHPPSSDRVEESETAISSMADQLGPVSNGVVEGFEAGISGMAARLGLAAAVGERAKEVFRKMEEDRAWPPGRGRRWKSKFQSERPLVYAACLSVACRAEGSTLTLRELAREASADGGVKKKYIVRLVEHIRSRLGKEVAGQSTGIGRVSVSSYVRRLGALVGLREAEAAVALEAARRLEDAVLDVRHNVDSVAAAVVCIVLERAGAKRPSVKDVTVATGVSHATITTVCRKLRAHGGVLFG